MTHQTSVSGTNNLKLIDLLGIKYIDKCRGKRKVEIWGRKVRGVDSWQICWLQWGQEVLVCQGKAVQSRGKENVILWAVMCLTGEKGEHGMLLMIISFFRFPATLGFLLSFKCARLLIADDWPRCCINFSSPSQHWNRHKQTNESWTRSHCPGNASLVESLFFRVTSLLFRCQ